jgi:hypothetical protein
MINLLLASIGVAVFAGIGLHFLVHADGIQQRASSNARSFKRVVGVDLLSWYFRSNAFPWIIRLCGLLCCLAAVLLVIGMIFGM